MYLTVGVENDSSVRTRRVSLSIVSLVLEFSVTTNQTLVEEEVASECVTHRVVPASGVLVSFPCFTRKVPRPSSGH